MTIHSELFDIVDTKDNVIGTRSRGEVHAQGLTHRAVHIHVINNNREVLLQKRSELKDFYPGKWTSSCSGHVDSGEEYLDAAIRELKEELSIVVTNPQTLRPLFKVPASGATDNEFIWVYLLERDGPTAPNKKEIAEVGWLSLREIDSWLKRIPMDFTESFRLIWKQSRRHFQESNVPPHQGQRQPPTSA